MDIDHIGIVVHDIEEALETFTRVYGYTVYHEVIYDPAQHVRLAMLASSNHQRIELIQPVDEQSPSYGFLKKGGGLQHICYRVKNLETAIAVLEKQGHMLFKRPVPAPLMGGNQVAFLYARQDKQIIELVETKGI